MPLLKIQKKKIKDTFKVLDTMQIQPCYTKAYSLQSNSQCLWMDGLDCEVGILSYQVG